MSEPAAPAGTDPDGENHGAEAQLRALRGEVDLLREVVEDFMHAAPGDRGDHDGQQAGAGEAPFEPRYPSLEEWVVDHFAAMYSRPTNPSVRWCAQWWDHAEAISRLEALWRSWEVARLDELRGMALWYRDVLDPQLAVLLSAAGPFAQCTPDRHAPSKPLPTVSAPEGYWTGEEPDEGVLPGGSVTGSREAERDHTSEIRPRLHPALGEEEIRP